MRIGVWNTAFLGDAVLTLPLIRVLKVAWPEADIDFYVRGGLAPLFEAQPELAHVYTCDKRGAGKGFAAILAQSRDIRARGYNVWVDAHLSLRSSFMAWRSGAQKRVGYTEAAFSRFVFSHRISRGFRDFQEIERLLRLAEALQIPQELLSEPALHWPKLVLPDSAKKEAKRLLAPLGKGKKIGLHPGSVWPTKRWTPEGFAHVLTRARDYGVSVVLLAGLGEEETAREVRTLAGCSSEACIGLGPEQNFKGKTKLGGFLDLSGKTTLLSLAAVIACLDGYVTNDSGPMHLAWAQGIPVTAMFGPTTRDLGFAPRGKESTVMEADTPCRPCGLHGHKKCPQGHFHCMKDIDPEAVWQDVLGKLEKKGI